MLKQDLQNNLFYKLAIFIYCRNYSEKIILMFLIVENTGLIGSKMYFHLIINYTKIFNGDISKGTYI